MTVLKHYKIIEHLSGVKTYFQGTDKRWYPISALFEAIFQRKAQYLE